MTEIRGRWGNAIALPAKCQGWGEFALSTLLVVRWRGVCRPCGRRWGVGWRSSRRQRPLATFRRPLVIPFRRLTNRLGKVKNGRFSRWRFEL